MSGPEPAVTSAASPLAERWSTAFLSTYAAPSLLITGGHGCEVVDAEGRTYVDLIGGIAVSSVGHAHPAVVEAVSRQAATLVHVSNLYAHPTALELAERITAWLPGSRAFLCNDGATANEAALKLARKHGRASDPDGRKLEVVAIEGGFHGRTFGALSVTGQPAKRGPFEPLPGPVRFVPYDDIAALEASVDASRTAAVIVEPILGEGGVIVPSAGYLAAVRRICDTVDALMIVDEVQTGVCRTGPWLASVGGGVLPDVVTLAKGLGGGLPVGACLARGAAADLFVPGDHGSTFGGNAVAAAAALAVTEVLEALDAPRHVVDTGARFAAAVAALDDARVTGQRGAGLLRAITVQGVSAAAVQRAAQDAGYLVNAVAADAIRIAPPLTIEPEALETFVETLPSILDAAGAPA